MRCIQLIKAVFCLSCLWQGVTCQDGSLSSEDYLAVVIGASVVGALFIVTIILVIVVCRKARRNAKAKPPSRVAVETPVSPKMAPLPITQARHTFDIYNQSVSRYMHPTYETMAQSALRLDKAGARSDVSQDMVFPAERPKAAEPTLDAYINAKNNAKPANQSEETETSGDWRSLNANDRTLLVPQHSTTNNVPVNQPVTDEEDIFAHEAPTDNRTTTNTFVAAHQGQQSARVPANDVDELYANPRILKRQSARNSNYASANEEATSAGPAPTTPTTWAPSLPGSVAFNTGTSRSEKEAANAFRFLDDLDL